jgi:Acyl-CoA synthetases (AMP-forming)/AMP-acid ligases II
MNSPKYSNIAMLLQGQSAARPNATAIMSDAGDWCYRELFEQAQVLAGWLQLRVSAPGTRVAYLGKEIPEYYLLLYACALAGKVLVPVNFKLAPPEVDYILSDSCAELLFVSAGAEAYVANGNGQTSTAVGSKTAGLEPHNVIAVGRVPESLQALSHLSDLLENKACVVEPALVDENTILVQLYTSGTTGYPKGVELAHSSFIAVGDSLRAHKLDWLDWHPDDVSLVGIPGFHVGGIWWAVQGFNAGSCNLIVESFVASDILARIRTHGITLACMVPSMIQMLLLEPTILQADLTSLRKIVYGGSPIASSVLADALVVLGCEFAQIYGLTETGNTAVCLPPGDHLPGSEKLKAAGKPYPGVEIKINDAEGRRLADEVVGEVCIRTPARMRGYWRNTEATKKPFLGSGYIRAMLAT